MGQRCCCIATDHRCGVMETDEEGSNPSDSSRDLARGGPARHARVLAAELSADDGVSGVGGVIVERFC